MVSIGDIPVGQALTGLINNAPNLASGDGEPAFWEFSSTLREAAALTSGELSGPDTTLITRFLAEENNVANTDFNLGSSMKVIRMAVNPNSVTFDQPKRWTKRDVRDGSVFFHFTNSRGQNNDILTLRFRGNTGNIDLRGSLVEPRSEDTGALLKLKVWHNLYQLTREPMLLAGNVVNVFRITYSSQLLPIPIEFRGFFNTVLNFEENAEKPNSRDYSFDFTVTGVDPDLDDMVANVLSVLPDSPTSASSTATDVSSLFGDGVTSTGG